MSRNIGWLGAGPGAQGAGRWARGWCPSRGAGVRRRRRTGWRAWGAQAGCRRRLQAGAQGAGRVRVLGERAQAGGRRRRAGRRAAAGARTRQGRAGRAQEGKSAGFGRALSVRGRASWAAGARPGRWARGLALGSALGALGPFSIRFNSFFFLESPNEHCSL